MANRIKGITVEIGGDTTKLSKALEGVNKNIKNTQGLQFRQDRARCSATGISDGSR